MAEATYTCAIWYWRHYSLYVEFCEDEQEAASWACHMMDAGEASIAGIQYDTGVYVELNSWPAYAEARKLLHEEYERNRKRAETARRRPRWEVEAPFDSVTTTVWDEPPPPWLGAQTVVPFADPPGSLEFDSDG